MSNSFSLPQCILKRQRVNNVNNFSTTAPISNMNLIAGQNVTLVKGRLDVTYDTAATVVPAQDGLAKLVKGIALQVNSGINYMSTLDLSDLVLYNQHLAKGLLTNDQPSSTISQTGVKGSVEFYFSPSDHLLDPSDPNFAIPGQYRGITNLNLAGTWGTDLDLGTGYTVDSATQISIPEQDGWVCGQSVYQQRFPSNNGLFAQAHWVPQSQSITTITSNLGQAFILPDNVLIRNIFLIAKDSTGVRSDTLISEFALMNSDGTYVWGPFSFASAQRGKAVDLDITPYVGCMLWQLDEDVSGTPVSKPGGILVKKYGDVKLVFSTTATGSIDIIFDTIIPRSIST